MKLSKKGFKKIISTCKFDDAIATYTLNFSSPDKDYCFEVQGTSFKSNDFEDCVMLTVEEAKAFWDDARDFYVHQSRISDDFEQLLSDINERIEQAEKCNA